MIVHTLRRTISTDFTSESETTITFFDGRTMTDVKPEPCIHEGVFCTGRVDALYRCWSCQTDVPGWDL